MTSYAVPNKLPQVCMSAMYRGTRATGSSPAVNEGLPPLPLAWSNGGSDHLRIDISQSISTFKNTGKKVVTPRSISPEEAANPSPIGRSLMRWSSWSHRIAINATGANVGAPPYFGENKFASILQNACEYIYNSSNLWTKSVIPRLDIAMCGVKSLPRCLSADRLGFIDPARQERFSQARMSRSRSTKGV